MKIENCKNYINYPLLNEGISNTSYLIDDKFVYRHKESSLDPFNKPINEISFYNAIKDKINTEQIIEYDINTGEKLSLFIDKTTRLSSPLKKEEMDLVATFIKTIAKIDNRIDFEFRPFDRLSFYKDNSSNNLPIKNESEIIFAAEKLYEKYPLVYAHNDLVKGNLLFKDKQLIVLDFEYAGLNIFLFDIASFISENNLSKNDKEYFLSQFENINKKDVQIMINFENILWYYWASYMYKLTNKQIFNIIKEEKYKSLNNI